MDKAAAIESFFGEYGLTELQISTILKLFESFLADNSIVKRNGIFEVCPKCGKVHPVIMKGEKAGSEKQMYRCTHCGRMFTEDHGTIIFPLIIFMYVARILKPAGIGQVAYA